MATIGVAIAVLVSGIAALGGTAPDAVVRVLDRSAWVHNRDSGTFSHVSALGGDVDDKVLWKGKSGEDLELVDREGVLYAMDVKTGELTLFDQYGTRINQTTKKLRICQGRGKDAKWQTLVGDERAYVVCNDDGAFIEIDPVSLGPTGERGESGGQVPRALLDDADVLWTVVPGSGEVRAFEGTKLRKNHDAWKPGKGLQISLVGKDVVAVDEKDRTIRTVTTSKLGAERKLPAGLKAPYQVAAELEGDQVWLVDAAGTLVRADTGSDDAEAFELDLEDPAAPLVASGRVYVHDRSDDEAVLEIDPATGKVEEKIEVPRDKGDEVPADVFVKDGILWINPPGSNTVTYVDEKGKRHENEKEDKARDEEFLPEPEVIEAPIEPNVTLPPVDTGVVNKTFPTGGAERGSPGSNETPGGGGGSGGTGTGGSPQDTTTTTTTPGEEPPTPEATKPDAPARVTGSPAIDAVSITWEPPVSDGGADVEAYVVQLIAGGPSATETIEDPDARSFDWPDLDADVDYRFSVSAVNKVGQGPSIETRNVRPAASILPPQGLSDLTLMKATRGLEVSWPQSAGRGGGAVEYVVRYGPTGSAPLPDVVTPNLSVSLSGLERVEYTVSVTPRYVNVVRPLSSRSGELQTRAEVPFGDLPTVALTSVPPSLIQVGAGGTWQGPAQFSGNGARYVCKWDDVEVGCSGSSSSPPGPIRSEQHRVHTFKVSAFDADGRVSPEQSTTFQLNEAPRYTNGSRSCGRAVGVNTPCKPQTLPAERTLDAADGDGDPLFFEIVSPGDIGQFKLDPQTGAADWDFVATCCPNRGDTYAYTATVRISDGQGGSITGTWVVRFTRS